MTYTKEKIDNYCGCLVKISLHYEWGKFEGWLVKASSCTKYSHCRSYYVLFPLNTKLGRMIFPRRAIIKIRKSTTFVSSDTLYD